MDLFSSEQIERFRAAGLYARDGRDGPGRSTKYLIAPFPEDCTARSRVAWVFAQKGAPLDVFATEWCRGPGPADVQNLWWEVDDVVRDLIDILANDSIRKRAKVIRDERVEVVSEGYCLDDAAEFLRMHGYGVRADVASPHYAFGTQEERRFLHVAHGSGRDHFALRLFKDECRWHQWSLDSYGRVCSAPGMFKHYWGTLQQVLDDLNDFYGVSGRLRRKALETGRQFEAAWTKGCRKWYQHAA